MQRASWDISAALHLPDGPAALVRDEMLHDLDVRLGWIHAYDADAVSGAAPRAAT